MNFWSFEDKNAFSRLYDDLIIRHSSIKSPEYIPFDRLTCVKPIEVFMNNMMMIDSVRIPFHMTDWVVDRLSNLESVINRLERKYNRQSQ